MLLLRTPRWARALLANLGLALFGTIVGLVLVEVVVRGAFPESLNRFRTFKRMESERGKFCRYDPLLAWSGIPNASGTLEWADARFGVRQNALGFRGPLYGPTTGARRVAVLGDSFVWGFGVEDEEVFPRVMERLSRAPLEMVNLGVSGYGTDQEYLLWSSLGHRFHARDVLLVVTITNDIFDDQAAERYGYAKPRFTLRRDGSLELENVPVPRHEGPWDVTERATPSSSGLAALAARWGGLSLTLDALSCYGPGRVALEERGVLPRRVPGYDVEAALYRESDPAVSVGWVTFFGLVEMLQRDVAGEGARMTVVLVPGIAQTYPDLWRSFESRIPRVGLEHLDPFAPNRLISGRLAALGIPVVDLLPAFREVGRRNPFLYFPLNGHWTPAGHRLAAETILEALKGQDALWAQGGPSRPRSQPISGS
jgi:lysophospholipase L1-like esterase